MTRRLAKPAYPAARRSGAVRTLHGQAIADPYDWLAGPETPEIAAWEDAQEALTEAALGGHERDALETWLTALLERQHSFRVAERGDRLFFLRDESGREQPALFVRIGNGPPRLLFDPATLRPAGHAIVQQSIAPSPDGAHVALAVAAAGGDAQTILLIETATGRMIDGATPKTIVPTIDWHPGGHGFVYNRNQGDFVEPSDRMTTAEGVYWHRVGEAFEDDAIVCPKRWEAAHVSLAAFSADGETLFVSDIHLTARRHALTMHHAWCEGTRLTIGNARPLAAAYEEFALYLGDCGDQSFFQVERDGAVAIVAIDRSAETSWRVVVSEGDDAFALTGHALRSANAIVCDGRIYVTHLHHAKHRLKVYTPDGAHLRDVPLPFPCSLAGPGGERYGEISRGGDGSSILLELWTHTHRQLPARYSPQADSISWMFPEEIDDSALSVTVKQAFAEAADGTAIPVFILDADPDVAGPKPLLLYGYGGFGASITPEFSPDIPAWLRLGGRYAIANIRGGGEYGKAWHEAGRGRRRQTVFDDFCTAAASLVERGYTTRDTLGIRGISNGGLLTAACAMQRPELFGAVISELPLLDGLALGSGAWSEALAPEYGNPVADIGDFEVIRRWSPLQNVRRGVAYPPIFIAVAECDSPMLVKGGRQFVATLQGTSDSIALFRLVPGCGHTGWPRGATVRTIADEITFLARTLDIELDWAALRKGQGTLE